MMVTKNINATSIRKSVNGLEVAIKLAAIINKERSAIIIQKTSKCW
jgi:hypothetical protein